MIAHPLHQFSSFWEGLGVGSLLANTAGNPKAGSDGSQYGCYGLNDEFPSILFHGSFFLRLLLFCFRGRRKDEGGRRLALCASGSVLYIMPVSQ